MKRRTFLQSTLGSAVLSGAIAAGLLKPRHVWAISRPDDAFISDDTDTALNLIFGSTEAIESDQIKLEAPLQAANGSVVPIEVSTTLPDPEAIAVIVRENPTPLLAYVDPTAYTGNFLSMRIKMAGTDKVIAYVKSGGKLYSTSQTVEVAIGGCGG